jgi:non-heme chloroperoxidase
MEAIVAWNHSDNRLANTPRRKIFGATCRDAISLTPSAVGKDTVVLTSSTQRMDQMTTDTTKDGFQIFYKDWRSKSAQPFVFHHGWPLSFDDRENQVLFLGRAS